MNEFQSEYYNSFPKTMQKYNLPPESAPFIGGSFQATEEIFFAFTVFLLN